MEIIRVQSIPFYGYYCFHRGFCENYSILTVLCPAVRRITANTSTLLCDRAEPETVRSPNQVTGAIDDGPARKAPGTPSRPGGFCRPPAGPGPGITTTIVRSVHAPAHPFPECSFAVSCKADFHKFFVPGIYLHMDKIIFPAHQQ